VKKKLLLFACLLLIPILARCQVEGVALSDSSEAPLTIVVLGSSTAAGTGPSHIDSAWVNRYRAYLEGINPHHKVINLAKGGYATYHFIPWGSVPPQDRPKPDPARCITAAFSLNPSAIIINLPSNDAAYGYSVYEQLANYEGILAVAHGQDVPVWITTTQPRNLSSAKRQNLMDMRDSTFSHFGSKAIDFWTGIAREDGTIDSRFDCGDGVHLNDVGHRVLFERVVDVGVLDKMKGSFMEREIREALKEFFSATKKLAQFDIIRSYQYTKDIGMYLCKVMYDFEPRKSREPAGYDGVIGTSKVQMEFNNCPRGHPVVLEEPFEFDELIIVLGPNCSLRPEGVLEEFIFYRFTREEVLKKFKTPGGKYIGGKNLFSQGHDKVLSL